jgi:hypothetical protein
MNSADSDSNDGHLGARSDVNGDASMGQQLAQKWCSDCHAVGAEDAEAYVPSFVLIAEMCFSIGGLNWYSRRSTVPGLRRGKQDLTARTLTPSILVRILVAQPGSPVFSGVSPLARKSATLARFDVRASFRR